jgi:hypothetical protein
MKIIPKYCFLFFYIKKFIYLQLQPKPTKSMNLTDAKSEIIDLSIFKDEISKLSFNLFREWTKSVKPNHNFDLSFIYDPKHRPHCPFSA